MNETVEYWTRRTGHRSSLGYSVAGGLAVRAVLVLQAAVVAHLLGVPEFGKFSIVTAELALGLALSGFGVEWTLGKLVAEIPEGSTQQILSVITHTTAAAAAVGLLVGVGLFLAAPQIATRIYHRPDMVSYFQIVPLIILATIAFSIGFSSLAGLQRFRLQAILAPAASAIQLLALTLGGIWAGLTGVLVGMAVGLAVGAALFAGGLALCLTRPTHPGAATTHPKMVWSRQTLRTVLAVSVPAQLALLAVAPVPWVNSIILSRQHGLVAMGIYGAAVVGMQVAVFAQRALARPALPQIAEARASGDEALYSRSANRNARIVWVGALVICTFVATARVPITSILYGSRYQAAALPLYILAFSGLAFAVNYCAQVVMYAANRQWAVAWLSIAWAVLEITLAVPLSRRWGAPGLAAAMAISYLAFGWASWLFVRRNALVRLQRYRTALLLSLAAAWAAWPAGRLSAAAGTGAALAATALIASAAWRLILLPEDREALPVALYLRRALEWRGTQ